MSRARLLSLLIASAIYYSILMQPSAAVTGVTVVFVSGTDWPTGSTMGTNSTWASLALKAYPNTTLTYDQPLNISNIDSASHIFRLRHVSITPATGTATVANFVFFNFVVENTSGGAQASFNYTVSGITWITPTTTSYMTLPASTQWILYVQTQAAAGANAVTANLQISVDVT
ncbi:MAG: hypothetical protein ABSB89_01260 [Candidatus Bathyarchaeia archaeon]